MNILFPSYGDRRANSQIHITAYAAQAAEAGHSCVIAHERIDEPDERTKSATPYASAAFADLLEGASGFSNSRPADLIHAWTPRENVRAFVEAYRSRHPSAALIVHLEDHEEAIMESYYQRSMAELAQSIGSEEEPEWHPRIAHPVAYKQFLAAADGITVLAPGLIRLLPIEKDSLLVFPIYSPPEPVSADRRNSIVERFGIPVDRRILVFPGGVTSNNREDLRALILAVKILCDSGYPTTLIKTGPTCELLSGSFEFPLDRYCLDLGYLDDEAIPELVSIADVLAQPGFENEFNRGRFPCKIPSFLASGRPCILPEMYVTQGLIDPDCCLRHRTGSPTEMAALCKTIFHDPKLATRMAAAARDFARERYADRANGRRILAFYESVAYRARHAPSRKFWSGNGPSLNRSADPITDVSESVGALEPAVGQLHEEIAELRADRDRWQSACGEHANRVDRMKSTFSWRCTAPLRLLRRLLLDRTGNDSSPTQRANANSTRSDRQRISAESTVDDPELCRAFAPPPNHPCYWKDYHLYCQADRQRVARYVDAYRTGAVTAPDAEPISILLPVFNAPEQWLRRCIDSVLAQVYANWELCIVDDASTEAHVAPLLRAYQSADPRIAVRSRETNGHISLATNDAFTLSSGRYVALLDHDDELPPHALARVAEAIAANPQARILYSDEDKIDENGLRHGPHFKSDWNYDLFLGCNMISHLGVYRRDAFLDVDGFRPGFEGAQDWDLALRIAETCQPGEIVHIPEILYHWRSVQGSTAHDLGHKSYAYQAQKRTIESHLQRISAKATVEPVADIHWRVRYRLPAPEPSICIVIPTKDRLDLLQPCLESVLKKTEYPNYKILVVDHESSDLETLSYLEGIALNQKVQIRRHVGPFNYSAINNRAIETIDSDLVCLLNNDTEVIGSDWLREMASHAMRPGIGIVGAKLLFPHLHVQHCGVIMGIGGIAGHAFKFLHKDDDGYIHRAQLLSRYSAVTGACMLFRKSLWTELGGFDEQNLAISYNDIDFCLRAGQKGQASLVTPFALLIHKESETRGDSQSPEQIETFNAEAAYMRQTWPDAIADDPFYNPNLTREKEDFSFRISLT